MDFRITEEQELLLEGLRELMFKAYALLLQYEP